VKKAIYIVSLLLLLPAFLLAGNAFSLGFGSISQFQLDAVATGLQNAALVDVHNWATGGELRAKVFGVNLEGYLLIQQGEIVDVTENGKPVFANDIAQRLFGMLGVGFSTKVADFTTLSLTAGTLAGMNVSPGFDIHVWAGEEDNVFSREEWKNFFSHVPLAYRMRLDFNLAGFSVGVHYQVPSQGYSYANSDLAAMAPDWEHGKIGASFITSFF
jgi:hypothetical protein